MTDKKKRYLVVGIGGRSVGMFIRPILNQYADVAEIAGLMDINRKRMEHVLEDLGIDVPIYTDLDEALAALRPDAVICTSRDSTHHEVIIKALEAGADAVTEKPMTTDDAKCRAILEAEKRTGRTVTVTFNYRYASLATAVKREIMAGRIGETYSVDFHWYLDCYHGTNYFRRWHGEMSSSGGLLVHKATHHFDLVNWWIDSEPETVFAFGARNIFGSGKREKHGERCMTCKNRCEYYWDITADEGAMRRYVATEDQGDHYVRDACVFRDAIDIYDTMTVAVRYANGKQMSYSLNVGMAYEGYRAALNGTHGRIDVWCPEKGPWPPHHGYEFEVYRRPSQDKGYDTVHIPPAKGGHGGGDPVLKDHIFRGGGSADPYNRPAGSRAGAMSILIGVAANKSIASGGPVRIADLLEGSVLPGRPAAHL